MTGINSLKQADALIPAFPHDEFLQSSREWIAERLNRDAIVYDVKPVPDRDSKPENVELIDCSKR